MKRNRPLSSHAQDVIVQLAIRPSDWCYGYDLMKLIGIKSGTLYPILMRLDERGLLESRWQEAEKIGKPPRHTYRLTEAGLKIAREIGQPCPDITDYKEQVV